ncbi:hypothetical protein [Pseudovibrio sp. JE062]|uniref:hypothetical protein n=1 Tax=Pseudovibrio sp. JE062 TaxID=439495 RepID=UPI000186B851|nr:hypothetical protein [Pseudovibrio sp. JE062]EEA94366.1 hypothetical protein PJE062_351 [Pseudovibrio sp. JE062]
MTQNDKAAAAPEERKQQLTERRTEPPAQTFATFTQALAGALAERRAAKAEGINRTNKNNN